MSTSKTPFLNKTASLELPVYLGFGAMLIFLGVVAFFSLQSLHDLKTAGELRYHTEEVRGNLKQLLLLMVNAETAERGYFITGGAEYLSPYRQTVAQIDQAEKKLRSLTSDNSRQQKRLDTLEPLITSMLGELKHVIALTKEGNTKAVTDIVARHAIKTTMDDIRAVIRSMDDEELILLKQRDANVKSKSAFTEDIILSALLTSIIFVISAIFIIHADMKKRKEAENALKEAQKKLEANVSALEAANKELEAFSYSVSHDLRAPLRHIDGFIDLLKKSGSLDAATASKRYLDIIADSAKQMGCLIDDLLIFSRMGRTRIEKSAVDMKQLVCESMASLESDCKDRRIEWVVSERLPAAMVDRAMLKLVWINLIGNAIKYSRQQPAARIEIAAEPKDGETVFFIRDNGVGFDMQYVDKLFGVFQRLHSADEFEGTGIGLANVKRIVGRHGGRVWAQSAVGEGATFYFSLPNINGGTT